MTQRPEDPTTSETSWTGDVDTVRSAIRLAAETVAAHRAAWDRLDAAAGDGDFGSTMNRGFQAVLDVVGDERHETIEQVLDAVSATLRREMGGTSGPLWGGGVLRAATVARGERAIDRRQLAQMSRAAADAIMESGGAARGDRTLLDALIPAVEVLERSPDDAAVVRDAVAAAVDGADLTRELTARVGRASYVGERALGSPDAGAAAVATLLAALAEGDAHPRAAARLEPTAQETGGDEIAPADDQPAPTGKHFINDPATVVDDSLAGFALAHADIVRWDRVHRTVARISNPEGQVGLVSGGGSGHEPLHVGFVGEGMLTVAVPGPVFASPSVDAIAAGMRLADGGAGVLQIVKNYTGDVLNFREAAELAREAGIPVATVIVDDDVATDGAVGRRGTGATIFVEKVAGALAAEGAPLEQVADTAQRVIARSASFGVALSSCTPPGSTRTFELGPRDVEIGVGIHGEAGREKGALRPASELVDAMLEPILATLKPASGARLLVLVSGLGATTPIEQYLVFGEAQEILARAGYDVARRLVGPYITALDMAGVLISVLELDDELTRLWDAPVHTAALRW